MTQATGDTSVKSVVTETLNSATAAAPATPASITQSVPDVVGQNIPIWHQTIDAGLNPAGAFASAVGLRAYLGKESVQDTLGRWSGKAPADTPAPTPEVAPDPPKPPAPAPEVAKAGGEFEEGMADKWLQNGADTKSMPKGPHEVTAHIPEDAVDAGAKPDAGDAANKNAGKTAAQKAATKEIGDEAAKQTAKNTAKILSEKVAESGLRAGVKEGGKLAAKQAFKLGASAALRVGALGLIGTPVLAAAITVALWALDPEQRRFVNGLISEIMGPGVAPAVDAKPWNTRNGQTEDRTDFLPLTSDGNRDPSIIKMDKGMINANNSAFRYHPDDVWPTSAPRITTTSDFSSVTADATALARHIADLKAAVTNAYQQHGSEPSVARLWAKIKPQLEKLEELQSTIVPTVSRGLMDGAVNANNFYQTFREVNLRNRMEINNSTSGLIPFTANNINQGNMSDLTGELKAALADMDRTSKSLGGAADNFVITAPAPVADTSTVRTPDRPVQPAVPLTPAAPITPTGLVPPAKDAKDLASTLANMMPRQMPGGMSPMGGGSPMQGGLPQGLTNPASALKPPETTKPSGLSEDALKKALEDKKNRSALFDPEKKKDPNEKPVDGAPKPADPKPGPFAQPVGVINGPKGPTDPASNFTDVKGKRYKFDTPKLANFVHNLTATDSAGHKTIQQAASEAGFHLPKPGDDIGKPISPAELKPGDVVMGPNNQNAVFLEDDHGKGMVLTEQNEVKTLKDFLPNGLTGDHVGLFHLQDDGSPAPAQQPPAGQTTAVSASVPPAAAQPAPVADAPAAPAQPAAPAAAPTASQPAAPAGSPNTGDTNPGVQPGTSVNTAGMNPSSVPSGN